LTGVIIKQSLLERAGDWVLYRKVIDYSTAAGSRDDFLKECVWAEADFANLTNPAMIASSMQAVPLPAAHMPKLRPHAVAIVIAASIAAPLGL
jgi:hypothetical protein